MKWKVVVDNIKTIPGTNGCHLFVWSWHKTKKEAQAVASLLTGIYRDASYVTGTERVRYAFVEKA